MKPITLCVFVKSVVPTFVSEGAFLGEFVAQGNRVIAVCPHGAAAIGKAQVDGLAVVEYDGAQAMPVQALNQALARHFDGRTHDLVLVNDFDCDLGADQLEGLRECAYIIDRYSFVSPRMQLDGFMRLDESAAAFAAESLPAATRVPYPSSRLVFIRGMRLAAFGLFDEQFKSVEGALRDYALKLNGYGFDSVMANRVFVKAASPDAGLPSAGMAYGDGVLLAERYPFERVITERFLTDEIGPVNRFMDELVCDGSHKKRILLDFANLPPFHCGTSEHQKGLARYFHEFYDGRFEVHIFTNREGAAFHKLDELYENIHYDEGTLGTYDVGLLAAHPSMMDELIRLNDHCLRIVHTMMDGIMLRCDYIAAQWPHFSEAIRCGLATGDGIITISDFSTDDCLEYYRDDAKIAAMPLRRVYVSADFNDGRVEPVGEPGESVPFDDYVLMVGNPYHHKVLSEAVEAVANTGRNYVVVGWEGEDKSLHPNVCALAGGGLSDGFLLKLYRDCQAVVFPSMYEGFGMPIVMAMQCRKGVVINRNDLNEEFGRYLADFRDAMVYYDTFDELPNRVDEAIAADLSAMPAYERTWRDVAREMADFVEEVMDRPVDCARLNERWHLFACFRRQIAIARQDERDEVQRRIDLEIDRARRDSYADAVHHATIAELVYGRHFDGHPARQAAVRKVKSAIKRNKQ